MATVTGLFLGKLVFLSCACCQCVRCMYRDVYGDYYRSGKQDTWAGLEVLEIGPMLLDSEVGIVTTGSQVLAVDKLYNWVVWPVLRGASGQMASSWWLLISAWLGIGTPQILYLCPCTHDVCPNKGLGH